MKILSTLLFMVFVSSCIAQCSATDRQKHFNELAGSAEWQPDKVIEKLNIQKGWYIGDLGAGGGYYSFRFAEETGKDGKVYAADINENFLEGIKKEADEKELNNIQTVHSSEDDSNFDDNSLDLIFIRNTFHHFTERNQYMKRLSKKLKAGGRIAIIDYKSQNLRFFGHNVSREDILSAIENTGLTIENEFTFIEKQHFFILRLQE